MRLSTKQLRRIVREATFPAGRDMPEQFYDDDEASQHGDSSELTDDEMHRQMAIFGSDETDPELDEADASVRTPAESSLEYDPDYIPEFLRNDGDSEKDSTVEAIADLIGKFNNLLASSSWQVLENSDSERFESIRLRLEELSNELEDEV